jgi:hypothetical protein
MLITIHNLAVSYKLLPSEVLAKGTTFDLFVSDTHQRWVKYHEAKAKGQSAPSNRRYSQQDLLAMMAKAKAISKEQ